MDWGGLGGLGWIKNTILHTSFWKEKNMGNIKHLDAVFIEFKLGLCQALCWKEVHPDFRKCKNDCPLHNLTHYTISKYRIKDFLDIKGFEKGGK